MSPSISIPNRLPVMMLSGCNLFPQGLLPLHLFEPRYREMLSDALDSHRMFCIGLLVAPESDDPESCVHQISTAGFVRACVTQPDGCSNLLLQGLQRIRLNDFLTDKPYVTAAVTPIVTINRGAPEVDTLSEEVRTQALHLLEREEHGAPSQIASYLEDVEDAELLGDLVAYHFIDDVEDRHALIAADCLVTRLHLLSEQLVRRLSGSHKPNG